MPRERASNPPLEVWETGSEPEFYVTHIIRSEPAGENEIRLYCGTRRKNGLKVELTCVIPLHSMAVMARQALEIASDAHNMLMWEDDRIADRRKQ